VRSALRGFPARLLLLVALALAVRWVAVAVHYNDLPLGLDDNNAYHTQAILLADHGGFYEPFVYRDSLEAGGPPVYQQSAGHPPGYIAYLAAYALVGLDSALSNRLASGIAGAAAVALIGILARMLGRWAGLGDRAADRAGLLAAFAAAIYPNLWVNDSLILSESLYAGLIALVLLTSYRLWRAPSWSRAALLGVSVGVAALTRSEGFLLLVGLVAPLALVLRTEPWRRRLAFGALAGAVGLAVMAPWMIFNLNRFDEPAPPWLATGSGRVLAFGNCDLTYSGRFLGYWNSQCPTPFVDGDESVIDTAHREVATEFMRDHLDRLPVVVAARVGRIWQVYRTDQGVEFDRFFERRGEGPARVGLGLYLAMVPVAVAGGVLLWRRRVTLVPLLAQVVLVTFTAATTFGVTRYRVPADVALVVLAGLGLAWVGSGSSSRARDTEPAELASG
jgi:4-amino-4-deoxy-L-arabinose transferase-like glycosyltransferase